MLKKLQAVLKNAAIVGSMALVACGGTGGGTGGGAGGGAGGGTGGAGGGSGCCAVAGDAQTPPQGTEAVISAWLTKGDYKGWHCESAPHAARSPSPHGQNRICNNTRLQMTASGNYPAGAASVKELYVTDGGTAIAGYAIGLKVNDGASVGASWYWYENNGMPVANGKGDKSGNELTVCTGCHQGAGSDSMHSGRDFVYTQVP